MMTIEEAEEVVSPAKTPTEDAQGAQSSMKVAPPPPPSQLPIERATEGVQGSGDEATGSARQPAVESSAAAKASSPKAAATSALTPAPTHGQATLASTASGPVDETVTVGDEELLEDGMYDDDPIIKALRERGRELKRRLCA